MSTQKETKSGIELIAAERAEQLGKHGRTVESDLLYKDNELTNAAVYLLTGTNSFYPKKWDKEYQAKLDKKSVIEKLKVAAALIAAEIDRLTKTEE